MKFKLLAAGALLCLAAAPAPAIEAPAESPPPAPAAKRTVSGIHVWTDRSVDCFSRETLLASLVKPGMSDEEKAVAFWRFVHSRIYHFPRPDDNDPMRVLNVYGYALCGTIQHVLVWLGQGAMGNDAAGGAGLNSRKVQTEEERRIMGAGWLLDSFVRLDAAKPPTGMGHSWCQFRYGGREHYLDAHAGLYVYTADGKSIASIAEISGDPTLVSDPVRTSVPFMPCDGGRPEFFYFVAGGGLGKGAEKTAHSMELRVRPGEALVFHFDKLPGGHFKRSSSWVKEWAPEFYQEGPHHRCSGGLEKSWRHYGNGEILFRPDLGKAGFRESLAEESNLAAQAEDGKPGLHPKTAGTPAAAAFDFQTPYIMVAGEVSAEFDLPKGAAAKVLLVAPGAREGKPQTLLAVEGEGGRKKAAGNMDMCALGYPYTARVRVELSGPAGAEAPALVGLQVRIITQINFHTLPRPLPGKNRIDVECAAGDPKSAGLDIEWAWNERGGAERSDRRAVENAKFAYGLELGEVDTKPADNPKYMRWLKLEAPDK